MLSLISFNGVLFSIGGTVKKYGDGGSRIPQPQKMIVGSISLGPGVQLPW